MKLRSRRRWDQAGLLASAAPSPDPPVTAYSYDFTQGSSGYYTFGTGTNLATGVDQSSNGRTLLNNTDATRPNLSSGGFNSVDTATWSGGSNDSMTISNARGFLRNKTGLLVRFTIQPTAISGTQSVHRINSGTVNVAIFVASILSDGGIRVSLRRTGSDAPKNIDSTRKLGLLIGAVVRIFADPIRGKIYFLVDDYFEEHSFSAWTSGYGAFEDVDALEDPSIGRRPTGGNTLSARISHFEAKTGRFDEEEDEVWFLARQAQMSTPMRRVRIDRASRTDSCAVKRSRPGATFEITAGSSNPGTNRITSVTVNGVAITSSAVDWATSHEDTATALAANINAYTGTSGYRAHSSGPRVIVESKHGGLLNNGKTLAVNVGGTVTVDTSSQSLAMGAVHTISGTVIAGQANGDIKVRLLSWDDLTTQTLSLRTLTTVTGSTSVARNWTGKLFVPIGAHVVTARLGSDFDYNETSNSEDGLFSGIRVLCNGQSNMKNWWAKLSQAGVFPLVSTRSMEKIRRNSGDGSYVMWARLSGGGGVFPTTNEAKTGPLNDGAGGNGTIRLAVEAASLTSIPIEFVCVAIGSSGTPTRIPADLAPGAFEAGKNWDDFVARVAGKWDFDILYITDGEEEGNRTTTFNPGDYTLYQTIWINLMRSSEYCDEEVPVLLCVVGPSTTTGAMTDDPLRPGYSYIERIRNEQLTMIYGGVSGVYVGDIPLDSALEDNQHGTYLRYETKGKRMLRRILYVYDPATYTEACEGAIADSMVCSAGTNEATISFLLNGGTGLTGISSNTNFTGFRFKIGGIERNVVSSSVSGSDLTVVFDGDPALEGQLIEFENLPGWIPDASNALCDNGTVKALAHPTIDPITCLAA